METITGTEKTLPSSALIQPVMQPAVHHWSRIRCGGYVAEWIAKALGNLSTSTNRARRGPLWLDFFRPTPPEHMKELFREQGVLAIQASLENMTDEERMKLIKEEIALKHHPIALLIRGQPLHWIAVAGYDDDRGLFYIYDPRIGPDSFDIVLPVGNAIIGYDRLLSEWRGRFWMKYQVIQVISSLPGLQLKNH